MAGTLYLDKKVGDLKLWELYMGFVILQLLFGIVIAFIQGVFDLTGIRGALSKKEKKYKEKNIKKNNILEKNNKQNIILKNNVKYVKRKHKVLIW